MNRKILLVGWYVIIALLAWQLWDYVGYLSVTSLDRVDLEPVALFNVALLAAMAALGFIVFKSRLQVYLVTGVMVAVFMILLGYAHLYLTGALIGLLFNLYGWRNIHRELKDRTSVSVRRLIQSGGRWVILSIFVMSSFAAYNSQAFQEIKNTNQLPPQIERVVMIFVEKTTDEDTNGSNEPERQNVINEVSRRAVHDINTFIQPYLKYAPPILAFALFLLLAGLSWLFVWVSVLFGWIIFMILKRAGIIKIKQIETTAEVIEI